MTAVARTARVGNTHGLYESCPAVWLRVMWRLSFIVLLGLRAPTLCTARPCEVLDPGFVNPLRMSFGPEAIDIPDYEEIDPGPEGIDLRTVSFEHCYFGRSQEGKWHKEKDDRCRNCVKPEPKPLSESDTADGTFVHSWGTAEFCVNNLKGSFLWTLRVGSGADATESCFEDMSGEALINVSTAAGEWKQNSTIKVIPEALAGPKHCIKQCTGYEESIISSWTVEALACHPSCAFCTGTAEDECYHSCTDGRVLIENASGVFCDARVPHAPNWENFGRYGYDQELTNSSVKLIWDEPLSGGEPVTSYRVYIADAGQGSPPGAEITDFEEHINSTGSTIVSVVITGLMGDTRYSFRVQAENSLGWGNVSEDRPAVRTLPVVPDAPEAPVVAEAGQSWLLVRWTAPTYNGGSPLTSYIVYLFLSEEDAAASIAGAQSGILAVPVVDSTEKNFTGLLGYTRYTFQVRALNDVGHSHASAWSGGNHTSPVEPGPPEETPQVIEIQQYNLTLAWVVPRFVGGSPILSYDVECREWPDGGPPYRLATTSVDVSADTLATVVDLVGYTNYSCRARAVNGIGAGNWSEWSETARTLPVPPEAPEAPTLVEAEQYNLTVAWSASTVDVGASTTGYKVWQRLADDGDDTWIVVSEDTGSAAPTYTAVDLVGYTEYVFKVAGINSEGVGAISNDSEAFRTLPVGPRRPEAPNVSNLGPSSFEIEWIKPDGAGREVLGYHVELADEEQPYRRIQELLADDGTATLIAKLQGSTSYSVRIIAYNEIAESLPGLSTNVTTLPPVAPNAPDAGVLQFTAPHTAFLSWEAPEDDGGRPVLEYAVAQALNNGSNAFEDVAVVGAGDRNATVFRLLGATDYAFRIHAINEVGRSDPALLTGTTPDPEVPATPGLAEITDTQQYNMTIWWQLPIHDGGARIIRYDIEVKVADAWDIHSEVPGSDVQQATVTNLIGDTEYTFRVRAVNSVGASTPSLTVTNRTLKVPPFAPGQPEASDIQQYAMRLSWSPPAKDGGYPIEGYKIWQRISGTHDWVVVSNNTQSDVPEYNVTELEGYTAYEFIVAGINFLGVGDNSGVSESARTLPIPPDPPSRPLVFAITPSSFSFNWTEPDARGSAITEYRCERSQDGAGFSVFYVAGATESECVEKGLQGATNYQVRVIAVNGIGESNPSDVTSLTTLDPVPPDPPVDPMVTNMAPHTVRFSWNTPDDFGGRPLLGYNVSYAVDGDAYGSFEFVESNTTLLEIDRLLGSTTYNFKVEAANEIGHSDPAVVQHATLAPIVSAAPGAPVVSDIQQYSVRLDWEFPEHDGGSRLTGFKIYADWEGSWVFMEDVPSGSQNFATLSGLIGDTLYRFSVSAINGEGESAQSSASVDARTLKVPPFPPGKPTTSDIQQYSMLLSWQPPTKDGGHPITGYRVWKRVTTTVDWELVEDDTQNETTQFLVADLEGFTWYEFKVAGINLLGVGDNSTASASSRTLPIPPDPPGPPTVFDITPSSFKFSWTAPDERGSAIIGYRVELAELSANPIWVNVLNTTTALQGSLSGKMGDTTYLVRVKAVNGIGVSVPGDASQLTTLDPVVPDPPTDLKVTDKAPHTITVTWTAPLDEGGRVLYKYIVSYVIAGQSDENIVEVGVDEGTDDDSFSVQIDRLLGGTDYVVYVKAVNSVGASIGALATHTTLNPVVSAAPGAPNVSDIQQYSVALAWAFPEHDGGSRLTGFRVYGDWEGKWVLLEEIANGSTDATTLIGLIGHTDYRFAVSAINGVGESARSDVSVARTLEVPPFSPAQPTTSEVDQYSMKLSWASPAKDGGYPIQGYRVWKRVTGDDHWSLVDIDTQTDSTELNVTNLEGFTEYEFVVAGINQLGVGDNSSTSIPTRTLPIPPDPPGAPTISDITPWSFKVSWTAPDDRGSAITKYIIEDWKGGWHSKLEVLGVEATMEGLEGDKTYTFRVLAVNGIGMSAPGPETSVTTLDPTEPWPPASFFISDFNSYSVDLEWTEPEINGGAEVQAYHIWYAVVGEPVEQVGTRGALERKFRVHRLLGSTSYTFQVQAENRVGRSNVSEVTATTLAATLPAAPGKVIGSDVQQHSVRVQWKDAAHDGGSRVTGYKVYGDWNGAWQLLKEVTDGSSESVTVTGLFGDTVYRFAVSAVNDVGEGEKSDPSPDVRTLRVPPFAPGKPTTSDIRQYSVNLSWSAPAKDGGYPISGYKVFQRVLGAGDWDVFTNDTETDATETVVTRLEGNTPYEFIVAAINDLGVGDVSVPSDVARTLPIPPAAPAAPNITSTTSHSVSFVWTPPDNGGKIITIYYIEMQSENGYWTIVKNTTELSSSIFRLLGSSTYKVRLRASNEIGMSDPGAVAIVNTLSPTNPASPRSMVVSHSVPYEAELQWETPEHDGGSPLTGYEVWYAPASDRLHLWGTTEPEERRAVVTGLLGSTLYQFRVVAISTGKSLPLDANSTTPAPIVPAAMVAPTILAVDQYSVSLNWSRPVHNGGAIVLRYTFQAWLEGTWSVLPTNVNGSDDAATLDGLLGDSIYRFRVQAVNVIGEGPEGNASVEVRTLKVPPFPPQNLRFDNITQQSVAFLWDPPRKDGGFPINGYKVWRRLADGSEDWHLEVENTGSNTTFSVQINGLVGNTLYKFAVAAINKLGVGERTEVSQLTAPLPPDAPGDIAFADIGGTWMDLVWEAPVSDGGSPMLGYEIMVLPELGNWTTIVDDTGSGSTYHRVGGLTENSLYAFVIRGWNAVGFSPWGPESDFNLTATVEPSPPWNVTVSGALPWELVLRWQHPLTDGGTPVTGYTVSFKKASDFGFRLLAVLDANQFSYNFGVLMGLSRYQVCVKASNAIGEGSCDVHTFMTPPGGAPDVPGTPVLVEAFDYSLKLSWPDPEFTGGFLITSYVVWMQSAPPDGPWDRWNEFTTVETSSPTITGLIPHTRYRFSVQAENRAGASDPGGMSAVMWTLKGPPPPPETTPNITVDGNGGIVFTWQKPNSTGGSNITGYNVECAAGENVTEDDYYIVGRAPVEPRRVIITDFLGNTSYRCRVAGVNKYGPGPAGPPSPPVTSPPSKPWPPGKPTLSASAFSTTALDSMWAAPKNDGGSAVFGYQLQLRTLVPPGEWTIRVESSFSVVTTHLFTNLISGTPYTMRVAAINAYGIGPFSPPADVRYTSAVQPQPPEAPKLMNASHEWLLVSWQAPELDGGSPVTGFIMEMSTDAVDFSPVGVVLYAHNTSLNVSELSNGTLYHFRVIAKNALGLSDPSPILSAWTFGEDGWEPPTSTVLSTTTTTTTYVEIGIWVTTTRGNSQNINPNDTSGSSGANGNGSGNGSSNGTGASTNGSSGGNGSGSNLTTDGNGSNWSDNGTNSSSTGSGTTNPGALWWSRLPSAPSAPVAIATTNTSVWLRWTPPVYNGSSAILGYLVWYRDLLSGNGWYSFVVSNGGDAPVAHVVGLQLGGAYVFKVQAFNSIGAGQMSPMSLPIVLREQGIDNFGSNASTDGAGNDGEDVDDGRDNDTASGGSDGAEENSTTDGDSSSGYGPYGPDGPWSVTAPLCGAPENLVAALLPGSVGIPTLTWQAAACNPRYKYRLWVQTGGYGQFKRWPVDLSGSTEVWTGIALNATDTWLSFKLQAIGDAGPGLLSDPTSPIMLASRGANVPETPPTEWGRPGPPQLGAFISGKHLALSWEGVEGATGYQLLRRVGLWEGYEGFEPDGTIITDVSAISLDLELHARYEWAVQAVWPGGVRGLPSNVSLPFVPSTVVDIPCSAVCGCDLSCNGPCFAENLAAVTDASGLLGCVNTTDGCPAGRALDPSDALCVTSCPPERPFTVEGHIDVCDSSCPIHLVADDFNCAAECSGKDSVWVLYSGLSHLTCTPENASMPHVELTFNLNYSDYQPNAFAIRVIRSIASAVSEPVHRLGVYSIAEGSIIIDIVVFQFPGEPPEVPEEIARRIRGLASSKDPALTSVDSIFNHVVSVHVLYPTTTVTTTTATTGTAAPPGVAEPEPLPPEPADVEPAVVVGASVLPLSLAALGFWWWWQKHQTACASASKFVKKLSKEDDQKTHSDGDDVNGQSMTNPFLDPITQPGGLPRPFVPPEPITTDVRSMSPTDSPTHDDAPPLPRFPNRWNRQRVTPHTPGSGSRSGAGISSGDLDTWGRGADRPICVCGCTFLGESKFCRQCGRERPWICSCGRAPEEDTPFCGVCGGQRPGASSLQKAATVDSNLSPVQPDTGVASPNSGFPFEPGQPGQPGQAGQPGQPGQPWQPGQAGQPPQPEQPGVVPMEPGYPDVDPSEPGQTGVGKATRPDLPPVDPENPEGSDDGLASKAGLDVAKPSPHDVPSVVSRGQQYDPLMDPAGLDVGGDTRTPSEDGCEGKALRPGETVSTHVPSGLQNTFYGSTDGTSSDPLGKLVGGRSASSNYPGKDPLDATQSEASVLKKHVVVDADGGESKESDLPSEFSDSEDDDFSDLDDWEDDGMIAEVAAPPVRGHAPWMLEPWAPQFEDDAGSSAGSSDMVARFADLAAAVPGVPAYVSS